MNTGADTPLDSLPAPDWSAIHRDILCPLCDYNLRGLTESRCPECGHRFEWREVLEQGDRIHPFLFEHQPHRPVWSFFKTFLASQRPIRFWQTVSPIHAPVPRRLILYWLILLLPTLACLTVMAVFEYSDAQADLIANRQYLAKELSSPAGTLPYYWQNLLSSHQTVASAVDATYPRPTLLGTLEWEYRRLGWSRGSRDGLGLLVGVLLWPWLTLAALMVFRISMSRARIKTSHVLRCVIYAADLEMAFLVVLLVLFAISPEAMLLGIVPVALLAVGRLWLAYLFYLRFPQPLSTITASQIIVAMTLAKLFLMMQGF